MDDERAKSAADQTLITRIEAVVRALVEDEQQVQLWFDTPNPQLGNSTPRALMQQSDSLKRLHAFVIDVAEAEAKERWREIEGLLAKSDLSSGEVWHLKRLQQQNDRILIASGKLSPENVLIIKPDQVRQAKIKWPDAEALSDEAEFQEDVSNVRMDPVDPGVEIPPDAMTEEELKEASPFVNPDRVK